MQAQPLAGRALGVGAPMAAAGQQGQLGLRRTRAVIGQAQLEEGLVGQDAGGRVDAGAGVLVGIGHDIADHLRQAPRVDAHQGLRQRGQVHEAQVVALGEDRGQALGGQFHGREHEGRVVSPVGAHQVGDQGVDAVRLTDHQGQALVLTGVGGGGADELGRRRDRGQRGADVVADVGDQALLGRPRLLLAGAGGAQLGAHEVEGLRPGAEHVAPVHGQGPVEIAPGDAVREGLQAPEGRDDAPVEEGRGNQGWGEHGDERGGGDDGQASAPGPQSGVRAIVDDDHAHEGAVDHDGGGQGALGGAARKQFDGGIRAGVRRAPVRRAGGHAVVRIPVRRVLRLHRRRRDPAGGGAQAHGPVPADDGDRGADVGEVLRAQGLPVVPGRVDGQVERGGVGAGQGGQRCRPHGRQGEQAD